MSPVGIFFVIAGWALRKKGEHESFKFGPYEIFRNKK